MTTSAPVRTLAGRTGFEVELLAPRGSSRAGLADALAGPTGRVEPLFHLDSEPSLVPGMGRFLTLTPGLRVRDASGAEVCTLVDDVTLRADLDPRAPAPPGWFRVLSDDARLLRLVERLADPGAPLAEVLDPVAAAFGTRPTRHGGVLRLDDASGATVALAAPVGGERERACEVVTPPLLGAGPDDLERLLRPARELGFSVPHEGAAHVHVDSDPFAAVGPFANVVRLFGRWRDPLHALLGTNPACRRLAPLPESLVQLVEEPWAGKGWAALRSAAAATGIGKFFDVNLSALVRERPVRRTVEVRVLPSSLDGRALLDGALLVEDLLTRCRVEEPVPAPSAAELADPVRAERALLALAEGRR